MRRNLRESIKEALRRVILNEANIVNTNDEDHSVPGPFPQDYPYGITPYEKYDPNRHGPSIGQYLNDRFRPRGEVWPRLPVNLQVEGYRVSKGNDGVYYMLDPNGNIVGYWNPQTGQWVYYT